MPIAFVNQTTHTGKKLTSSINFPLSTLPSVGNTLVVFAYVGDYDSNIFTIQFAGVSAWHQLSVSLINVEDGGVATGAYRDCEVWYGLVDSSPTVNTITINLSAPGVACVNMSEFSGVTSARIISAPGQLEYSSLPIVAPSNTISTTTNDSLVVGMIFVNSYFPPVVSNYHMLTWVPFAGVGGIQPVYANPPSGLQQATWTFASDVSNFPVSILSCIGALEGFDTMTQIQDGISNLAA